MRYGFLFLAGALALASTTPVRAQDEETPAPTPEDQAAEWSAAFERGLDLLRAKSYDESIKAFQVCVQLFPDRAVAYYNIACAFSLKKDVKKAVDWLGKSFDKGFLDLAHVGRDTDLDNIREEASFKDLVSKTRKQILANRPEAVKIVPKKADPKAPLVVWLHADGANVEETAKKLGPLADALGAVLLVPSGRTLDGNGAAHWDTTAETCVVHDVKQALKSFDVDPEKVVIAGELDGASHALKFATEHGWKRVVAAAGLYEKVEAGKAKDLRVYLFAPRAFDAALQAAQEARDDLLSSGARVRIARHEAATALPDDLVPSLERAVRWALGDAAQPEVKKF